MGKNRTYRIAVIPGDGIGKEVVVEGMRVIEAAGRRFQFLADWTEFPWGCDYFIRSGEMMPKDGLDRLRPFDALFLGAVGTPGVPDHVSLWGLLIPIRRSFRQYVNLRPVRLLRGIQSPLRGKKPGSIDFYVVRENNEGEYSNVGGRIYTGTEDETAVQEAVFTRRGVTKVMDFAFRLARERPRKRLTSATKSNGIVFTMPFWDQVFQELALRYGDVETDQYHIDALCAKVVLNPEHFDVIVASNLFGDILSDLGPAIAGSIGIAPSGNLNPEGEFPSMFEPVHGSAPDIAGKGIANPIGQIWSGAMMLDHLGEPEAARAIEKAIETALDEKKLRTPDLGGKGKTEEFGRAVAEIVASS